MIMLAGALAVSGTASAQFANTGASNYADTPSAYNRISLSYAPQFMGGETLNGFAIGYTYGCFVSSTQPWFVEVGLNLNYNFSSFDGMFGYSNFDLTDADDLSDLGDLANMDYDDLLNYDWDHTSDIKANFSMLQLNIPINFGYRFSINENLSINPYIGLNLKFNLLAKCSLDSKANDDDEFNNLASDMISDSGDDVDYFSKDDLGDYAWKRFQIGWHIGAGVNYKAAYFGLNYGTDFNKIAKETNSSNLYLTLGYQF